jgi:hypothetical protein
MAWHPLAYILDQDLHYSKQHHGKIPPAVKEICNFKLFNAGLKTFVEAQLIPIHCPASICNLAIRPYMSISRFPLGLPIIGNNQGGDQILGCHI